MGNLCSRETDDGDIGVDKSRIGGRARRKHHRVHLYKEDDMDNEEELSALDYFMGRKLKTGPQVAETTEEESSDQEEDDDKDNTLENTKLQTEGPS